MSKKTLAVSDFVGAAKRASGSHLTIQARMQTAERFATALWNQGFQVRGVESIGGRHVAAYVQMRQTDGVGVRTIQNELAHIRSVLSAAGRDTFARSATISNKALGVDGSSRAGTKVAASDEQYQAALVSMSARDAGIAVTLKLERELGLRASEAIRSGPSLATWERQLAAGQRVSVVFGTKGGRPREAMPADRERALAAVREAREVAAGRNGTLVAGANLQQALSHYRNEMHRHAEITGHQLRYAYACDRVESYLDAGFSRREALALTSMDLGHGDGRGRYVERVYTRR